MGRAGAGALLAALLLAPLGAWGYQTTGARWPSGALPLPYAVSLSSAPTEITADAARDAVVRGFDAWTAPSCTDYRVRYAGASTHATVDPFDGTNDVAWITRDWPPELGSEASTIAATTPTEGTPGVLSDVDVRFNAVRFAWTTDGRRVDDRSPVDTQSLATHEAGHVLGLDHSPVATAVMYSGYAGGLVRVLDPDDIAGVCALYPARDGGEGDASAGDAGRADAREDGASDGDAGGESAMPPGGCRCELGVRRAHSAEGFARLALACVFAAASRVHGRSRARARGPH